MRVLLVHHALPPSSWGGSEIYTLALARRLARDHDVTLLHRTSDRARAQGVLEESREGRLRLLAFNNLAAAGFESYRDPELAAALAAALGRPAPDVVHVGHLSGLSTGLVFEARRRGIPVVVTLHDFWTVCPLGQLLTLDLRVCPGPSPTRCLGCVGAQVVAPPGMTARLGAGGLPGVARLGRAVSRVSGRGRARIAHRLEEMRELLRSADLLLSPSRFLRDRLAGLGIAGIEVLPNGHEPLAPRPRVPDPQGRVRFGFVGTAIPSKGVHVLAEAYRRLDDPRALVRIHGPFPPYHGDSGYEARVRRLLGPRAGEALRGAFDHARLGEVLSELDALVVPSLWEENAPLTVQEAFLARLPVVVSDHGGLAELVRDGVDGLRFRPGDPGDLARVLRRMLDEPELTRRLGSAPPPVPDMDEHLAALVPLYERARRRYRERVGRVGVVVLDRGQPESAARALASALDGTVRPESVVVINGPGPAPAVPGGTAILRLPENRGFAAGMNAGVAALRREGCDRLLLLNNDATLEPGALRRLAEALEDPRVAAAGPVILRDSDGRVESRGARFDPGSGRFRLAGHGQPAAMAEGRQDAGALSGAVLMLSARALDQVGPLDERYFHSFEDADWCLRARAAGLRLVVVEGARARHLGSGTLGSASPERLYYAARNHLLAASRHRPLPAPRRWLRAGTILALNLGHALRQAEVPRLRGVKAVLAGTLDSWRGRTGERGTR